MPGCRSLAQVARAVAAAAVLVVEGGGGASGTSRAHLSRCHLPGGDWKAGGREGGRGRIEGREVCTWGQRGVG